MEKITLPNDVPVFYLTVPTFPNGIKEAFDKLIAMVGMEGRNFYGISYMDEQENIVYKAAVSENVAGEGKQFGCASYTISKGAYLGETMLNWMTQTDCIKDVFGRLMQATEYDANYPCVEWYKSDRELLCLVRSKPVTSQTAY